MSNQTTEPDRGEVVAENTALAWHVRVAHHPEAELTGRRAAIPHGTAVELGRGSTFLGGRVFDSAAVSREHARLASGQHNILLSDMGSRNGTHVNGTRRSSAELEEGDVVGVGPVLLVVELAPLSFTPPTHETLIGESYAMASVLADVQKVARHTTTVFLWGESGSGKELLAREIHARSGRPGRFCAINSGALTSTLIHSQMFGHARGAFTGAERDQIGFIESADKGTLFLDEIGEASPELQVALLRFLEDGLVSPLGRAASRAVDVRIITASHRDLHRMVHEGRFREDLYARLSGWVIRVPALRERVGDIPSLAAHFIRRFSGRDMPLSRELALALLLYSWPRNVRELRTLVERAQIDSGGSSPIPLTKAIEAQLSKRAKATPVRRATDVPRQETRLGPEDLSALIAEEQGNIRKVAARLDVSRNTLYRWLHEYLIDPKAHRPRK